MVQFLFGPSGGKRAFAERDTLLCGVRCAISYAMLHYGITFRTDVGGMSGSSQ